MTALYVAFDVFPRPKGSSSHIASMVAALEAVFGSVRLLCLGTPEMPAAQREGGVEILRYRRRKRDLLDRATGFARFVESHAAALRGRAPLAVFRDPWGGMPVQRARMGCPAIFEVNALPSWELSYSRAGFRENAALRAKVGDMERRCLREARAVLCVSRVTGRALEAEGVDGAKIRVIPNVARDVFFEEQAGELSNHFGYVGGLQPWQGLETAVEAFALIAGDCPDAQFVIVTGDDGRRVRGVQRLITRRGLADRVAWSGSQTVDELARTMGRLRFTVAPLAETERNTVQGCCPVKMVESVACGTPVIASDLAVCRELVTDGVDGLLAGASDKRAWALAMRRLLRDNGLRDRLGRAARERARAAFAWPVVQCELQGMFRRVAAGGE